MLLPLYLVFTNLVMVLLSQFSTVINLQPTLWCSIKATKPFVLNIFSSDIFKNQLMVKYIGKTMSFSTSKLNDVNVHSDCFMHT